MKEKIEKILKKIGGWSRLTILQSLLCVFWLLLIPKEPANAVIFGYSLRRLALLIPMSLPIFAALFARFLLLSRNNSGWLKKRFSGDHLPRSASWLVYSGMLITAGSWSFSFLFFFLGFSSDLGAFYRLIPMIISYFLIGTEAMLFVPFFVYKSKKLHKSGGDGFPKIPFLGAFLILLAFLFLIEATGLGKDPERVSIISLGSPILEGQIWYITGLVILALTGIFSLGSIPVGNRASGKINPDLAIAAILWLMAVVLWMSLPLPKNNYFAPQAQPPNFEKYPFSDAEQYDYNSLYVLFGSLKDFVVSKPLYVSLLTILHAIGGFNYANIILLQTLIIAVFPPILYLIGRELHSRISGVVMALLAIFREVSSIQSSSMANVSNSKLMLSDMHAALLAGFLALIFIRWLKQKDQTIRGHEFLIGGLIGTLILTRIQTFALIPFALLCVIIRYFPRVRQMLVSTQVLLTTLALVISPVLLRNHSITGVYWIDNPSSSSGLSRILTTGIDMEEEIIRETDREEVVESNTEVLKLMITRHFGEYLHSVADNFSRNSISSFLVMPVRVGNSVPLLEYLTIQQPFWEEVYSYANWKNLALVIINIGLISYGFAKIIQRNLWPALAFTGFYITYSLSSAVVRLSGWRFILPVDWIIYSMYAIGIVDILIIVFGSISRNNLKIHSPLMVDYPTHAGKPNHRWSWYLGVGVLFLFTGAFIPSRELLFPEKLPEFSRSQICEKINDSLVQTGYTESNQDFSTFCLSEDTRVLAGYGFYPRYFKSGEGYYSRSYDPWYGRQDYARMVFRLIGIRNSKVYIKTEEENLRFPNGSLVFLAGKEKTKFEAQFVLVESQNPQLIISSEFLSAGIKTPQLK